MSVPTSPASSRLRLEPVRWWHLAELARLDARLFDPDVWSSETFWAELAAPGRHYLVAVDADDEILGYAGLAVGGSDADVQTIAVAPGAQGRGVGRLLLAALVERAVASGARAVLLEVRADNARAIGLYAGVGFERIAVRRGYYQPGAIDAHIMRLRLPSGPAVPPAAPT